METKTRTENRYRWWRDPRWIMAILVALITVAYGGTATATVLYDGSLGTAPESQGWLAFGESGGTASRVTAGGGTTFSTTSNGTIQAGYSNYAGLSLVNPAFPMLDRVAGYAVTLDMQVLSESHANNDRSGVSLLVLSQDLLGIEVAFWEDEVWVQSGSDFLHAEGASFDTTVAMTRYDLTILGSGYSITADGNPLLAGSLRDYSSFGPPYSLSNFLYLGDNTTSASGSFEVERLAVVPEPSMGLVAVACVLSLLAARGKSHPWPFSTWPTMKKPRFFIVGDRRIVRRQTFSTAC